jgi:hypothetical protein
MQNRILGMQEIYTRLLTVKRDYPLSKLVLTPDQPIAPNNTAADTPGCLILEAEDSIMERSYKSFKGYPVKRQLEVVVELWDRVVGGNVRSLYSLCRQVILAENGVLLSNVFLREEKTYGPFNLGNPGVLGFRVVFVMHYYDEGPN